MSRRASRVVVAVLFPALLLVTAACDPPAPPPGPPTGVCRPDPFGPEVRAWLDSLGAEAHHVTAAAYDDRTGCWYHLRQGVRVTTASVVKMEVMAVVLAGSMDEGRPMSRSESALVGPMMYESRDSAASQLWRSLGGAGAMQRWGDRFGLSDTDEVGPVWGLSSTTAEDQARFVERLLQGDLLDAGRRAQAWFFLRNIREDQQWGIRAGVPDGWQVGHKNGFAGSACCGWRVNSVGYVADPAGGGYSLAVLSDGWASLGEGVPMVEAVSSAVAASLTAPPPAT